MLQNENMWCSEGVTSISSQSVDDGAVYAPGWPGGAARWPGGAKDGVATALLSSGRVWFTISHGILNEVYCPRVDEACTRDMGFIVTVRGAFLPREKRADR